MDHQPPPTDAALLRRKPRGRRMAFVTLAMAGVYLWCTSFVLDGGERWGLGWEGVRRINSARALMSVMIPRAPAPEMKPRSPLRGLLPFAPGPVDEPDPAQVAAYERMKKQIIAVEGVVYIWERLMWGFCGFLAAVALLSWLTPWGRLWHLLGAGAVFLITALTLAGMRYVDIPDGGGYGIWPFSGPTCASWLTRLGVPTGGGLGAPNLLPRIYFAMGAILSAYGWLLVAAFLRPGRAPYSSAQAAPPPEE